MHRLRFALVLCFTAACGPSPTEQIRENVHLRVERDAYLAGDTIRVALKNAFADGVTYGNCPTVQRYETVRWVDVETRGAECTVDAVLTGVRGRGEAVVFERRVTAATLPGEYRFRAYVSADEQPSVLLTSNTYRIRPH